MSLLMRQSSLTPSPPHVAIFKKNLPSMSSPPPTTAQSAKDSEPLAHHNLTTLDHESYHSKPLSTSISSLTGSHSHDQTSDTPCQNAQLPASEDTDSLSDGHRDYSPPSPLISSPGASEPSSSRSNSTSSQISLPPNKLEPDEPSPIPSPLLPLPTSTPGPLTLAHQQAMANRIAQTDLQPSGLFDPALYTPVFLHDTLMLPGSLANLLGKESPLDILNRLTPARLPSHTTVPDSEPPHAPRLIPSTTDKFATGLVLLGSGRDARKAIKEHYQPFAKRRRINVVVEVRVPVARMEREAGFESERWRVEARRVVAQVYVWRGGGVEDGFCGREWDLGRFLSGEYEGGLEEMEVVGAQEWGGEKGEGEGDVKGVERDLGLDGRIDWTFPPVYGEWGEEELRMVEW
ncbi:hypothetical protein Q7P37_001563 [Cladosporium fusiforme]